MAAKQEIDRLSLLVGSSQLSGDEAARLVADNARYNVFELAERCLAGRRIEALRILEVLRGEGIAASVVLWSIAREIRNLNTLSEAPSFDHALRQLHVPARNRQLYETALRRLPQQRTLRLLRQSARVDHGIKGLGEGREWDELGRLVLAFTGAPTQQEVGSKTRR